MSTPAHLEIHVDVWEQVDRYFPSLLHEAVAIPFVNLLSSVKSNVQAYVVDEVGQAVDIVLIFSLIEDDFKARILVVDSLDL